MPEIRNAMLDSVSRAIMMMTELIQGAYLVD